jgi:hypothetical protein
MCNDVRHAQRGAKQMLYMLMFVYAMYILSTT